MAALLVADREGRYLDGDEEALAILGISLDELRRASIEAFSGPHADVARMVWHGLAQTGAAMPTGDASLYRPDGSSVRVRFTRIAPRADGAYELEFVAIATNETSAPPVADHPSQILDQWRAAERAVEAGDSDGASDSAEGLRQLYQYAVTETHRKDARE